MKVWSIDDPGAGDMGAIASWRKAVTAQAQSCEDAIDDLENVASASTDHWEGKGATEFISSLGRRIHRLELMAEACRISSAGATIYIDRVEDIQKSAVQLKRQIAEAQFALDHPSIEAQADYKLSIAPAKESRDSIDAANSAMEVLAYERHTADQNLMAVVLGQLSGKIDTDHARFTPMDFEDRLAANLGTFGILGSFAGGIAPRDRFYTDGYLPKSLAESGHMKDLRADIIAKLKAGEIDLQVPTSANRNLSSDVGTLFSDALNAAYFGTFGNLPETMVGSFGATYEVVEIDENRATVTFTITNDTTAESLNRVPGLPYEYFKMPWAPGVNLAHDFGGYQSTGQTVVWTEIVEF